MDSEIKQELDLLLAKEEISLTEAKNFLKKVSSINISKRDRYLKEKKLAEAKDAHDELGKIYRKIASRISDKETRTSLISFADYWLRSGETEIFIEPVFQQEKSEIDNGRDAFIHLVKKTSLKSNINFDALSYALKESYGNNLGIEMLNKVPNLLNKLANVNNSISLASDEVKILSKLISLRREDIEKGADIHVMGMDLNMTLREDLDLMKKMRSYKGIRHERGLRVRGQRTRSSGRTGAIVGVSRKKEGTPAAAPAATKE